MGRRVDVGQLVGAADIRDRLGFVRTQDVHSLRRRDPLFPEPVAAIGGGPRKAILVWYMPDVLAWAKRKGVKIDAGPVANKPRRRREADLEEELAALRRERAEMAELREQLGEIAELRERLDAITAVQDAAAPEEPTERAEEA
jgi:hypothetical protein